MVSLTLSVPEDIKREMEHFPEMNWSGFIRKCIIEKTNELSWKEQMLATLQEEKPVTEWAVKVQKEGRKGRFKELKSEGLV